jgi:hypothetical protein
MTRTHVAAQDRVQLHQMFSRDDRFTGAAFS